MSGPFFAGWEVYHVKGSPADPDRIYASPDGGEHWATIVRDLPPVLSAEVQTLK